MKRKPIVGEILYSLNVGNAARWAEEKLTPVVVTGVRRKYFTCKPASFIAGWMGLEYHIDSWRQVTDFVAESKLYETEQEWLDEKEADEIALTLRTLFSGYGKCPLSLDQLRRIKDIINENQTPEKP